MQFGLEYRDGYEVTVLMEDESRLRRWFPLRNFGEHQGDAKMFKMVDCPDLTDTQIRMLVKNFDRNVKYKRINGRRFIRQQL